MQGHKGSLQYHSFQTQNSVTIKVDIVISGQQAQRYTIVLQKQKNVDRRLNVLELWRRITPSTNGTCSLEKALGCH